uniref:Putative secreted protein n=1 Tax=Anopheles darlingi TaxID=43151 RepID=A0A2M4D5R4_ANODA
MRKRLPRMVRRVEVLLAREALALPAHSSRAVAAMEPHTECAELPVIIRWDGYHHSMRPSWVQIMANTPH